MYLCARVWACVTTAGVSHGDYMCVRSRSPPVFDPPEADAITGRDFVAISCAVKCVLNSFHLAFGPLADGVGKVVCIVRIVSWFFNDAGCRCTE